MSPRLPTFSSTVIQPMRSRTRSAYGSDASQYGNADMLRPISANRSASHTLVYALPKLVTFTVVVAAVEGRVREQATGMGLMLHSSSAARARRRWDGDGAIVG
jgi:hypothetical protein|uniref:Uncharacterized protein n=1 Tax=Zea mays TaxID=4577 RepID=C4J5R0_MAIZE|nr:unknown [Zea mays]